MTMLIKGSMIYDMEGNAPGSGISILKTEKLPGPVKNWTYGQMRLLRQKGW